MSNPFKQLTTKALAKLRKLVATDYEPWARHFDIPAHPDHPVSGDAVDAFRHGFSSAVLTIRLYHMVSAGDFISTEHAVNIAEYIADLIGYVDKINSVALSGSMNSDINQDLWNNAVGRQLARYHILHEEGKIQLDEHCFYCLASHLSQLIAQDFMIVDPEKDDRRYVSRFSANMHALNDTIPEDILRYIEGLPVCSQNHQRL